MKKNFLKIAGLGLCALLAACLLAGCLVDSPVLTDKSIPEGKGVLNLYIAGSNARTVYPDMSSGVTFEITCTPENGEALPPTSETTLKLDAGEWTIKVDALDDGDILIASIEIIVDVIAGVKEDIEVTLEPVTLDDDDTLDQGTFSWEIDIDDNLLSLLDDYYIAYKVGSGWVILGDENADFETGSVPLDPGSYLMRLYLEGSTGTAGEVVAVHIYSGLDTLLELDYLDVSLVEPQDFTGVFTITTTSAVVDSIEIELHDQNNTLIDIFNNMEENAGEWIIADEIPGNVTEVSGTIYIYTDNNGAIPLEFNFGPIDAIDFDDADLGSTTIYTVTVTTDDNGIVEINGIALDDGDALDVLEIDDIIIEPVPNIGCVLDELRVDSADVTGDMEEGVYTIEAPIVGDIEVEVIFTEENTNPLIFEWIWARDGAPTGGAFAPATTTLVLSGEGEYSSVPIRYANANATNMALDTANGGILMNGNVNNQAQILLIGTNDNTPSTPDDWDDGESEAIPGTGICPEGVFDFKTGNPNGILVTFGLTILENAFNSGTGDRNFNVHVNNSTNSANNSPLNIRTASGTYGSQNRIAQWVTPTITAGVANDVAVGTYVVATETFTTIGFKPGDFNLNANAQATLEKAFIGIVNQAWNASPTPASWGAKVLITSIRIATTEYVPPAVDSVTITGDGVTGTISKTLNIDLAGEDEKTVKLGFSLLPYGSQGSVAWTGGVPGIAVNATTGMLTMTSAATATITATVGGKVDTVAVTVTDSGPPSFDPNLIFEWNAEDDAPVTVSNSWSSGSNSSNFGTFRLPGKGSVISGENAAGLPISIASTTSNLTTLRWVTDLETDSESANFGKQGTGGTGKGIFFEGSATGTANITNLLLLGSLAGRNGYSSSGDGKQSAATNHAPGGVFDFSTLPTGKTGIKVTLTGIITKDAYEPVPTSNRRVIAMYVNHNNSTAANTPLGGDSRIFQFQNVQIPPASGNLASGSIWTPEADGSRAGTLESSKFVPTSIPVTPTNITVNGESQAGDYTPRDTLETAYIGLWVHGWHTVDSNQGPDFLLTGIKIEYID